jgi:multiple sugar transport system permease protein
VKKKALSLFILIFWALISIFPLYWLITASLKASNSIFTLRPDWFFTPTFEHYHTIFTQGNFVKALLNSLVISIMVVLITLPIASMAGYAFSRFKFKGKKNFFFLILTTRMAPPVVFVVPLFMLLFNFNLIDTYLGMILVYILFNFGFGIWVTRGFFEDIPTSIEEAACVDGCSPFRIFTKVSVPMVMGGLITTGLLMFIFTWNEFLFASILTKKTALTFPVQLTSYFGWRRVLWGELSAASTIGAGVPIVLAVMARNYIVSGLTMGAVKE